jgi:small subunit ribosomal protein S9
MANTKKETEKKVAPKRDAAPKTISAPVRTAAPQKAKPASGNAPLAHGVGRRKSAVARVWLRRGKGEMTINQHAYERYFDTEIARQCARSPFVVYPNTSHYDISANVVGGGKKAQADAVKLGVARALVEINPEIRPLLRQHGLLTVDSRVKERKKYGQRSARAKFQFVKR